jgi:hypothetical protein
VEKKHNPISNQSCFCEIKNEDYPIFPVFVPKGDLWEARGDQWNKNIP